MAPGRRGPAPVRLAPRAPRPRRHHRAAQRGQRGTSGRRASDMLGRLALATLLAAASSRVGTRPASAPCVRPARAGTQVQGEVKICAGRYRIPDRDEQGVIIAASSGTRIDLTGVVLESGDSVSSRYVGIGVASRGVDGVTITGGAIHGYRLGIRLEGGRSHRI